MRYVIGAEASVDAAQLIWIELFDGLLPAGRPGTVGAVVSGGGPPPSSPAAWSTTTWSKLATKVLAAVSPTCTRPTGVLPVFVAHVVASAASRYRFHEVAGPTVPHSSMLCQPVPRLVVVVRVSEVRSFLICTVPFS